MNPRFLRITVEWLAFLFVLGGVFGLLVYVARQPPPEPTGNIDPFVIGESVSAGSLVMSQTEDPTRRLEFYDRGEVIGRLNEDDSCEWRSTHKHKASDTCDLMRVLEGAYRR